MTSKRTAWADLPYRPCVGMALFNRAGRVFVGQRVDNPGAWQMPQGGIDAGEAPQEAFFRELREEIGTDHATILEVSTPPLRYDLPPHLMGKLWGGRFRGQEQTWIAARFEGGDDLININAHDPAEFSAWEWIALDQLLDRIVPFKRATYREVIMRFSKYAHPL